MTDRTIEEQAFHTLLTMMDERGLTAVQDELKELHLDKGDLLPAEYATWDAINDQWGKRGMAARSLFG